ncbi:MULTISPECIES: autoinducer binding domain-containing protein [Pseudomonas]|jgi:DNA-binding CsgD family transcriptional regulator|uniref:autoinducer binding domain-containing protein n=1 Tax=Pseudomonas TaxID=286 RepID=UPI00215C56D8|nr:MULTISPECIES: autoinducer binding domain-containing protein [unclassified Pseudomonas]MCR8934663.1 autoinducer binding domain-containing protein [Pseudomonas sp. S11A4]MCR8972920.1 autoinducer binding domain-containing protein [Pseudomonas sp. S11P7]
METWKESQLKQLTFAKGIDAAYPILLRFAENLGFNFCAISVVPLHRDTPLRPLQINNYPSDWNSEYELNSYIKTDPLISHCNHSMSPIVWNESVFAETRDIWQGLQKYGLQHGWSQSFHHAPSGLCSIISLARRHCSISPLELYEHFGYMFYASSHLSELFARTLPAESLKPRQPHLSSRELEVLKLSAVGKTAYEISKILSLSERTVNYHVQNVIEKLHVCNKISAVIKAARTGII